MRTLLFAFLLLGCNIAFAQTNQDIQLDEIKLNKILIKNSSNTTYSFDSPKKLQAVFGKAKSIVKEKDDMNGGYIHTYKYAGFETYFKGNNWEGTTVTGNNYSVLFNNIAYKTGDNITKFKSQFPLSYAHREHREKNYNALHIMITNADTYIFIKYDDAGIVTEITIEENNS